MRSMYPLALVLLFASITHAGVTTHAVPTKLDGAPTLVVAKFRPVEECQEMGEPQPVDSPHPLMASESVVQLTFIIGWDGKVYSPFVLTTNGTMATDRMVLKVVSSWRFRPATCNNVPVNSEGLVTIIRQ